MALLLGIDTGGTYTDAVLFDDQSGVVASAKALTTKHDLAIGIRNALDAVLPHRSAKIGLVSLSTTLATNAIVEGQTSPVCLLLLGYPADALELAGLGRVLGNDSVIFVNGGHTETGEEQVALDLEAARRAILAYAPQVAAFAVSGYFAVRNPAHELAVRDLVRELTGLPVTCGHELTSDLHAPRRALTTVLNARLIPLLQHLILSVRQMLDEKSIRAPLMVVKGDGSLIDASVALERPVETILSGPAASVVGARHLSGEGDVFVVDMGGTTTDIALLHDGRPVLNAAGAIVGGWQTMVEAIAVHTSGLGGDSEIRLDDRGELVIGPRRVVPLSLLASQYPGIVETLRLQLTKKTIEGHDGQFALRQRPLEAGQNDLTPEQREVWDILANGPLSLEGMLGGGSFQSYCRQLALARLIERGLAVIGGFTPTDAAHVLGYHHAWSAEAAQLGAALWGRRAPALVRAPDQAGRDFCQAVMQQLTVQLGRAAVSAALAQAHDLGLNGADPLGRLFVDRAMAGSDGTEALVDVTITLRRPLVAIGAPVSTYYPVVAERLHTRLCIPPHAEVANAVGAVVGSVVQTARALIDPLPSDGGFRVHLPNGIRDFDGLEEAAAYATQEISRLAETQARRAGAADVQVQIQREDHLCRSAGSEIEDVFVDTEMVATAIGRPRLADKG